MRPFQAAVLQPVKPEDPTNNLENICGLDDTDDEDNADELEESGGMTARPQPRIPWIIEHAAQLKNRYMVGTDGRTPTERLRGRGVQRPVYELREKVLFLPLAPARRGDFGARFDYGIHLGCRSSDGQAYVGTSSGGSGEGQCDSSVLRRDGTQNPC